MSTQERTKPILYIDVDGVLFGLYGDPQAFQLRPGVSSFIQWAMKHFDCKWLTSWPKEALVKLYNSLYNFGGDMLFPDYVDWRNCSRKQGVTDRKTAGIDWNAEWFWIDDGPVGVERMDLRSRNAWHRWIEVRYEGADELERVRAILTDKLVALTKEANTP